MSFTQDLTRFEINTGVKAQQVVKKVVLEMLSSVIKKTPVDTGNAQGNWEVGVDSIPTSVRELSEVNKEEAVQKAITLSLMELSKFELGHTVYIVNNVGYIGILEMGRVGNRGSNQAPQGMVMITVIEFQPLVQSIAIELRGLNVP